MQRERRPCGGVDAAIAAAEGRAAEAGHSEGREAGGGGTAGAGDAGESLYVHICRTSLVRDESDVRSHSCRSSRS
jgi:hypothetical protein